MIDLNDVRRFFDENDINYEDRENCLSSEWSSLGNEKVPCTLLVGIINSFFVIECFGHPTRIPSMDVKYLKLVNDLNDKYFCFKFVMGELGDGSLILVQKLQLEASLIPDIECFKQKMGDSLSVYDNAFYEFQCAKYR